jgi:hypothetical protein
MVRFCTDLIGNSTACLIWGDISGVFQSCFKPGKLEMFGTSLALVERPELKPSGIKGLTMNNTKNVVNNSSPFSERTKQVVWFASGALCGLAMLSICKAAIPPSANGLRSSAVTDDTAIYQNMSEIQVKKEHTPNFDSDISNLSQMERRYQARPALKQRPRQMAGKAVLPVRRNTYQN